jgi:hypothetical protein
MNILKQHWDKFLLTPSLILLITFSLVATIGEVRFKPDSTLVSVTERPVKFDNSDVDFSYLSQEFVNFQPWVEPADTGHRLAVSRQIEFLPDVGRLKPFDLKATDRFGIDREWKTRYGLSLADPNLGIVDSDGDGFLNLDEFLAKTDPTNAENHPPYITKLRIIETQKIPFRMVFRAYNIIDGVMRYQINLRDAKDRRNRSPQVVTGDVVEEWKIGEFRRKVETRFDPAIQVEREFDESELDLEHTVTKEKITLILNKEVDSPESVLSLRDLSAGFFTETIKVKLSRDFEFRGKLFKLININEANGKTEASVLEIASGARHKITQPLDYEIEAINRAQQKAQADKIDQNPTQEELF